MMLWRRDCLSGSAFRILVAATGKARLPTVESLKGGITRRLVRENNHTRRRRTIAGCDLSSGSSRRSSVRFREWCY